jgi:hypothetical protein
MNSSVSIRLDAQPAQFERLKALQAAFAQVCNELAPVVQRTRVWNRVALHHMTYRDLRARYPALGSQMVCNAIYSVSRTCRIVFQAPGSPFHLPRLGSKPLPLLRFSDTAPVYFDRHTLSLRGGRLSLFTLDGRMRFELALGQIQERAFHERKLLEISLMRKSEQFELHFLFAELPPDPGLALLSPDTTDITDTAAVEDLVGSGDDRPDTNQLPEYVLIEESP